MDADDLARRCAERMYADDVASRALGIVISGVAAGAAVASMTVRDDMINGHGICHGGYLFTPVERSRLGRSGLYDVTVRTSDGEPVAEFRGRSRSLGRRLL